MVEKEKLITDGLLIATCGDDIQDIQGDKKFKGEPSFY